MRHLTQFLLARIAEDEAAARQVAEQERWLVGGYRYDEHFSAAIYVDEPFIATGDDETAAHVVRWEPARVLAECAFKREIVRLWDETEEGTYGDQGPSVAAGAAYALAAVYADHPDYDEAWRPSKPLADEEKAAIRADAVRSATWMKLHNAVEGLRELGYDISADSVETIARELRR